MRERDIDIMVKAWLAIASCRTRGQLETARRYADLACSRLSDEMDASSGRLVLAMAASKQQERISPPRTPLTVVASQRSTTKAHPEGKAGPPRVVWIQGSTRRDRCAR